MNRVLFSPVGSTDPIRDNYDGAMLHIVRHYRPQTVYLYLTHEMNKKDEFDNRFEKCIKRLHPDCVVVKKRSNITDVHDFDKFIFEFGTILAEIKKECCDAEILLNISSGTPQIKSSLCLEVVTNECRLIPIQVLSPRERANDNLKVMEAFDMDFEFENLLDELPEAKNRCIEPKIMNFKRAGIKTQVKSLISDYDYYSAYKIINDNHYLFTPKVLLLANHLNLRYALKTKEAQELTKKFTDIEFFPVKNFPLQKIVEYFLVMSIKQQRGELNDFILKISPILTCLTRCFIERNLKFPIYRIMDDNKLKRNKIYEFNSNLLRYLEKELACEFRDGNAGFSILNMIIGYIFEERSNLDKVDIRIKDYLNSLRFVEKFVRNVAAHEMESIDEDLIKLVYKKESAGILSDIKFIIKNIFGNEFKVECIEIYGQLNKLLFDEMDLSI